MAKTRILSFFNYYTHLMNYLKDPLRKNAIFLITTSATNAILGFFFWMLAARFYPAEYVGLATAIISAANLLVSLSGFGFGVGMVRFLSEEKDKPGMVNSCFTIVGIGFNCNGINLYWRSEYLVSCFAST